jgi:Spy/CpxP family protein refolding chaperone
MSPFVSGALGALSVLLLAALVRRAVWHRRFRRLRRGGFVLRGLFHRLGTRPEQEAVVTAEADALAAALADLRGDARALRADLAELLAAPTLDRARLDAALAARLARFDALKARAAEALARIHTTLDPEQRTRLAELVRSGPGHHGFHGGRCRPA